MKYKLPDTRFDSRLAQSLFDRLNESRVTYSHWKSNVRLDKALAGQTDLDLLVARKDRPQFVAIISAMGFKAIRPRAWNSYPSMEDYVGLDSATGHMVHLHVHYKLILGETNVKSYHVPLETLLLSNTELISGVQVPFPETELLVYVMRLAAKSTVLPSAHWVKTILQPGHLRSQRSRDLQELRFLADRADPKEVDALLNRDELQGVDTEALKGFVYGDRSHRGAYLRRLRRSMAMFRRFGALSAWFLSGVKTVLDIVAAAQRNNRKSVVSGGLAVAIVGCDGSGKSTVVKQLIQRLRWKVRAKTYYLGCNRRSFSLLTRVAAALSLPFRAIKKLFPSAYRAQVSGLIGRSLIEYFCARDRLHRYRNGRRDVANGGIVVFERFPLPGVMDWPLILERDSMEDGEVVLSPVQEKALKNPFVRRMAERIYSVYDSIDWPDLVIYLAVSDSEVFKRRPWYDDCAQRTVHFKNQRAQEFYLRAAESEIPIVRLDAEAPLESVVAAAMGHIWERL